MFNDENLGYRGTVFAAARRPEPGITFQAFREDSWGCLKAAGPATSTPEAKLTLVAEEGSEP